MRVLLLLMLLAMTGCKLTPPPPYVEWRTDVPPLEELEAIADDIDSRIPPIPKPFDPGAPAMVTCPDCGHEFAPSVQEETEPEQEDEPEPADIRLPDKTSS